jgi:hypothetical protein
MLSLAGVGYLYLRLHDPRRPHLSLLLDQTRNFIGKKDPKHSQRL